MALKQREIRAGRRAKNDAERRLLETKVRKIKGAARRAAVGWFHMHLMRRTWTKDGFRERLTGFWADHFTTRGRAGIIKRGASPFVETAIRPNLTGKFEDLLIAAVTHPMMIDYLSQIGSIGPNSQEAQRLSERGRKNRGLNENLAREILELHTLGVSAEYGQTDVREFAELLAGLTYHVQRGAEFREEYAEPGTKTILGRTYSGDRASFEDVKAALRDIARHPTTAHHIATKLAIHFVADTPDPNLISAMERAFFETDGALIHVYHAMLVHPSAWAPKPQNVMPPFDFMAASFRALGVPPDKMEQLNEGQSRKFLISPLNFMGHAWETPPGPDGLYEADADWITPQALATRVQWAMRAPRRFMNGLPDPRRFVDAAIGPSAPEPVRFAASAAESRPEAIGLVLISPAFQRV